MEKAKGHGTIEMHKNRKGEFYFKKIAANGEQISKSSESYTTKAKALHGLRVDILITLENLLDPFITNRVASVVLPFPLHLNYNDKTVNPAENKVLIINEP